MKRKKEIKNKETLIFTDPHIFLDSIEELNKIFGEICTYSANKLVMMGDYFEKNNPSAQEIFFGTKWAIEFKKNYKEVIFLRGNHDKVRDTSAVDYLTWLGIKVVDDYEDNKGNYFGHYMLNESKYNFGEASKGIKDFEGKRVLLGHQHSFEKLKKDKIYHLGAIRYVSFQEAQDKTKFIAKIDAKQNIHFIPLSSPIPMYDVNSLEELDQIEPGMVKVRYIINSFEQFKREIDVISKLKHKYNTFKIKLDFEKSSSITNSEKEVKSDFRKLEDVLKDGVNKIKDIDVKTLLEEVLNEE